jgi:hypothetical protein
VNTKMSKEESDFLIAHGMSELANEQLIAAATSLKSARERFAIAQETYRSLKKASDDAWMIIVNKEFPEHRESIKRSQAEYGLHRELWARVQARKQMLIDRFEESTTEGEAT